jgi:ubiquinone/menaquinone biosynthesis C-methylase UbiE
MAEDYNILNYWAERENPNKKIHYKDYDKPVHMAFLRKHLKGSSSVLDLGPGVGRLFEAYINIPRVEGYDISDTYKSRALNAAKILNINFNLTIEKKVGNLPYKDKEFDAAVATEVLLHQPLDRIDVVMSELIRVAKKVIVITWMESGHPVGPRSKHGHCFHYDYLEICKRNNWEIIYIEKYKTQAMFVYKDMEDNQ